MPHIWSRNSLCAFSAGL